MNTDFRPAGILTHLYWLPISLDDRLAAMNAVGRLVTPERLRLERIALASPDRLTGALIEALGVKEAMESGDVDALWEELLVTTLRGRLRQDAPAADRSARDYLETPAEHRKHKDEQKARMLQGAVRRGGKIEKDVWRAVELVIDRGHKLLDLGKIEAAAGDELEKKFSLLVAAWQSIVQDQAMLLHDVLAAMQEEEVHLRQTHEWNAFITRLGIAPGRHLIDHLQDIERDIPETFDATSYAVTLNIRHHQHEIFEEAMRHDEKAKFVHLAHAYAESLRVLFDCAGALGIAAHHLLSRQASGTLARGVMGAIALRSVPDDAAIELRALRQLYLGVDEWQAQTAVADHGGMDDFDFDAWDRLNAQLAQALSGIAQEYTSKGKDSVSLLELVARVHAAFDASLNPLRTLRVAQFGDAGAGGGHGPSSHDMLFVRVITMRDTFLEGLTALGVKRGRGVSVALDGLAVITDSREDAIDAYDERVAATVAEADRAIGEALAELSDSASEDSPFWNAVSSLQDSLAFASPDDDGWQDEAEEILREYAQTKEKNRSVPQELHTTIDAFARVLRARPLAVIRDRVDTRWSSDRPYEALPAPARAEKYKTLAELFNILLTSLAEKEITVPQEFLGGEGGIAHVRAMAEGISDLYEMVFPSMLKQLNRMRETEQLLANSENYSLELKDLTRDVFMVYDSGNIEKLKKLAQEGEVEEDTASGILEVITRSRQSSHTAATTFVSALGSGV